MKPHPSSSNGHANIEASDYLNPDNTVKSICESHEQLLQIIEQLKTENAKLQLFINIAAHELRTPIMPIVGYAEMLQEDIGERKEVRAIIHNAKILSQLADNILDGSKIENHSLKLNKEPFNLKDILTDIIDDYDGLITLKGKRDVKVQYEAKDIFLVADKIRIGRVISNLLNNAIKFTAKGDITIRTEEIKPSGVAERDKKTEQTNKSPGPGWQVHVSIKDTGTGLSSAILPRLFSKFASTDSGGTGLGLFVSKSIIESHGGYVEAQNNPSGTGATFGFTLPLPAQ